jgi:hypothetical protein
MSATDDIYGTYWGDDLTEDELDYLVWKHVRHLNGTATEIREKLGRQERTLATRKWFDYRMVSYGRATLLYAAAYDRVLRVMYARHIDKEKARYVKGFKDSNIFEGRGDVLTGLWKGRQLADAFGMPYDFFIETAMEKGMRIKRNYLPRPQQLYSGDVREHVGQAWADHKRGRLTVAQHPDYTNASYDGRAYQDAHHKYLVEQISTRSGHEHLLADFIWKRQMLPVMVAERYFEASVVERAREIASA